MPPPSQLPPRRSRRLSDESERETEELFRIFPLETR